MVVIKSSLSWLEHLDALCSKLCSLLCVIKREKYSSTLKPSRPLIVHCFRATYAIKCALGSCCTYQPEAYPHDPDEVNLIYGRSGVKGKLQKSLSFQRYWNIDSCQLLFAAGQFPCSRTWMPNFYNTRNVMGFNLPVHHTTRFQKPTYAHTLPEEITRTSPRFIQEEATRYCDLAHSTVNRLAEFPIVN